MVTTTGMDTWTPNEVINTQQCFKPQLNCIQRYSNMKVQNYKATRNSCALSCLYITAIQSLNLTAYKLSQNSHFDISSIVVTFNTGQGNHWDRHEQVNSMEVIIPVCKFSLKINKGISSNLREHPGIRGCDSNKLTLCQWCTQVWPLHNVGCYDGATVSSAIKQHYCMSPMHSKIK